MVVNFGHVVFAQVRQLVTNLNKKNFKATSGELNQLLEIYGHDVYVFLFRSLINHLDLKNSKAVTDQTRLQLLAQELGTVMTRDNFVSIICQAFEGLQLTEDFCSSLSKTLKFSYAQHLTFALALAQSTQSSVQQQGIKVVKSKLSECSPSNLLTLPIHILSNLILVVETTSFEPLDRQLVMKSARAVYPRKTCAFELWPLLYADGPGVSERFDPAVEVATDSFDYWETTQLAEAVEDMGYTACSSVEVLGELFQAANDLEEQAVAQLLMMMARTLSGLPDGVLLPTLTLALVEKGEEGAEEAPAPTTWDSDVLMRALKKSVPLLDWVLVANLMDSPTFKVETFEGLKFIFDAFELGEGNMFPIDVFFGKWKNTQAQLKVMQILINSSDKDVQESFEYLHRRTKLVDVTPHPVWSSVDVIETLLLLADAEGLDQVFPIFRGPLITCPELLLYGLAQSKPAWGPMYRDLISMLMSKYLMDSSCIAVVRQVWGLNKTVVVQGMVDMTANAVTGRQGLARSFEVAQELGLLLEILGLKHSWRFILDLAMFAAQQNAIPFANWVTKNAEDGGCGFVHSAVAMLRLRAYGGAAAEGETAITAEHAAVLMQALQAGSFDPVATAEIQQLVQETQEASGAAASRAAAAAAAQVSGMGFNGAGAGADGGESMMPGARGNDDMGAGASGQVETEMQQGQGQQNALFAQDIEEEANSHFQRIYTSQVQIESVVQMLKNFKSSQEPREQEVFACMIHNLFDEYRFFPRYPERELLITGKLFGSLIQNQLVSSITLGIALRYVLEALRKPLRGNMFKFGMCALEQFKQRLAEWPQYCHHILQISHIRQSHAELIDYIQAATQGRPMVGDIAAPDTNTPPQMQAPGAPGAGVPGAGAATQAPMQPGSGLAAGMQGSQLDQQLLRGQLNVGKPNADFNLSSGSEAAAPTAPAQQTTQQAASATQAQANAYAVFDTQQSAGTGAFAGFSQGFGQDPQHQLPSNLQNFASDSRAAGAEAREAAPTVDMRNAAVQQTLSVVSGSSAFGATTNVDMLMAKQHMVPQPDTAILDKVHFVFNNLSVTNLDQKERDLMAALPEHYIPWLCQYVVIKRAAQEQNYLSLYCQFVDRLDKKLPQLVKGIVTVTVENINLLLLDDKVTSSSSVRSLLKNLGSWLGMLTLQRNKPILQKHLDVRNLLIEAYERGRLVAVVPFVAKVLENVQNSRIFKPPNPWTMLILSFLAEIHPMNDLRLNIKFEVEVLCKALNRDLKEIKASSVLKGRSVNKESNPDWNSRSADGGLSALKPLPTVPDSRLMAAAAGLAAQAGAAGASHSSMAPAAATSSFGHDSDHATPSSMGAQMQTSVDQSVQNINIQSHIVISQQLALFQQFPHLIAAVIQSVNEAIKAIVGPVVERSVTIACVTTRELILKDFAQEQDETHIKSAAHMMVQNLAGSLALVTSKEPLRHNISIQVRQMLTKAKHEDRTVVMSGIQIDERIVDEATIVIASENLDLGCNLIEKAATEKAIREIDGHLDQALAGRRKPNTHFNNEWVQCQQWSRMLPEALRPKSGAALVQQARVYDDFARLPRERLAAQAASQAATAAGATSEQALRAFEGKAPTAPVQSQAAAAGAGMAYPMSYPMQQAQDQMRVALEKCSSCLAKAEEMVMRNPQIASGLLTALPQGHDLQQLLMQSLREVQQSGNKDDVVIAYGQRIFRRIYDTSKFGRCALGVDFLCASLTLLAQAEGAKRLHKEVLGWLLMDGESMFNRELTLALVQHRLVSLSYPEYVSTMAKAMDLGRGSAAVDTVVWVVQQCLVERRCASTGDCAGLLDALAKVAQNLRKAPDHLVKLLDVARNMARAASGVQAGAAAAAKPVMTAANLAPVPVKSKDAPDPAGLKEQVANVLDMWTMQVQTKDDRSVIKCMTMIIQHGWLKGDDISERFFRLLVTVAMERCSAALVDASARPAAAYVQADSLAKLMRFLVSYHEEWSRAASGLPPTSLTKQSLVNKFFAAYVRVMHTMQSQRKTNFNQKPFHHLFLRILADLYDFLGEPLIFSLADVLHAVQPRMVPAFTFSWLELVSHRHFMPKLLQIPKKKGWASLHRLLVALFKYLHPHLRHAEMAEPIKMIYKGTLRVLLVLLHDFPEFLSEYHSSFCDTIPPSCIQLRNLILSAFPRNMTLPDPLQPQLKVDKLAELSKPPTIMSNLTGALASNQRFPNLKTDLDNFLRGNPRDGFLQDMPNALLLHDAALVRSSGSRYNVALINSMVLYAAASAISNNAAALMGPNDPEVGGACLELFVLLSRELDYEGRYLFLNAIANQLRYPNSHTNYMSCMILELFAAAHDKEIVREQITRVLIERTIVQKPHPWGLLITLIELIKNPTYNIWQHSFVRSCKEIEQLFQSVAGICSMGGTEEGTTTPPS